MSTEKLDLKNITEKLTGDGPQCHTITLQPRTSSGSEVIPDSEEERTVSAMLLQPRIFHEVIEISSDESEVERVDIQQSAERTPVRRSLTSRKSGPRLYASRRRIIESSDENSDCEVIEISDSDSDIKFIPQPRNNVLKSNVPNTLDNIHHPIAYPNRPVIDESIIILDEPRSSRKPVRVATKKGADNAAKGNDQEPTTPKKTGSMARNVLLNSVSSLSDITTNQSATSKPAAAPRQNTKKAKLAAELQKRHEYAQQLFTDLNQLVFKGGLPADTQLKWNNRLLTTAGKAKFHRNRDGVQTTEIELADKILDCEERIRNTLSHEMCHLATWVIDKNINEGHGKLFMSWANKVMRKRPDIDVTVRHDYNISYPYEWKCEKCAKIYGRFSKSIKPEECVCGACKEGTLIPQFTSKRKPNTPKLSRMAASRPQDSPRAMHSLSITNAGRESDLDVEAIYELTRSLATTSLA